MAAVMSNFTNDFMQGSIKQETCSKTIVKYIVIYHRTLSMPTQLVDLNTLQLNISLQIKNGVNSRLNHISWSICLGKNFFSNVQHVQVDTQNYSTKLLFHQTPTRHMVTGQ